MQGLPVASIDDVERALHAHRYVADRSLATTVFLALTLDKPLLLEGEAGVGKTEVGKVLAEILDSRLIRLQCYEGIDVNNAVYEWAYAKQMLHIRLLESAGANREETEREIYSPQFLVKRPLLRAIESDGGKAPVLLIDEIDRADDEFEAFLLELLSDFQVTVPELGTVVARARPLVVLTSNRTRELHDALKRRCLYHWIDYPSREREAEIVRARIPGVAEAIAARVCAAVERLRGEGLHNLPGGGETIDWARAPIAPGDDAPLEETAGGALKGREDAQGVTASRGLGGG